MERALVDLDVDRVPVDLLVVCGVVFDGCYHAFRLHAADVRDAHAGREVRIFAKALEVAAAVRRAHDVDGRRQQNVLALGLRFARNRGPDGFDERGVEARRQRDARGKRGRGSGTDPRGTIRHAK
jgi:hypothetical protein